MYQSCNYTQNTTPHSNATSVVALHLCYTHEPICSAILQGDKLQIFLSLNFKTHSSKPSNYS